MENPPRMLDGAELVCFSEINSSVRPTGKTIHRKDGKILGPVTALAICQYSGENSFYLFYCDEKWRVLTDTFHVDLDAAKSQAEFEYRNISAYWKISAKTSS